MTSPTSAQILDRYKEGDEQAADELFHRYLAGLTILARSRLSPKLAARTDPEDVVLSAYRSFFVGAREGRFILERSGDLWRLLVAITMHKLHRNARWNRADKRSIDLEQPLAFIPEECQPHGREASPEEAIAIGDELAEFMTSLDPFARRVLELRLQEENLAAISIDTGRSERTVRRTLAAVRRRLENRFEHSDDV